MMMMMISLLLKHQIGYGSTKAVGLWATKLECFGRPIGRYHLVLLRPTLIANCHDFVNAIHV